MEKKKKWPRHIVQCFVLVCMPEHVGCALNMCEQRLNVCISSFIPWSWSKQDHMLQVYLNKMLGLPQNVFL